MKHFKSLFTLLVALALITSACGLIAQGSKDVPNLSDLMATAQAQLETPASAEPNNPQSDSNGPAAEVTPLAPVPTAILSQPAGSSGIPNTGGNTSANPVAVAALEGVLENVYNQVNPSVVNIRVDGPQGGGVGSGFVWDKEGHIVTNNHVVAGATTVVVSFSDGTIMDAKVIGTDPDSDLGVIQVKVSPDRLNPVTLADSRKARVGELAIAIGSPFALEGTMTVGIISALGRSLPVESQTDPNGNPTGPTYNIPDVIQTDAAINPGNSGGVLVDVNGQVLGVTAAIESPVRASSGVGFVIPSAIVAKVVPSLIQNGSYQHPWLGITGTDLVPGLADAMQLSADQRGALIIEATPGGPAEKAGLRGSSQRVSIGGQQALVGGDVVTAIDGNNIRSMADLIAYTAANTSVGQTITLTIFRGGQQQELKLTLGARPSSAR